MKPENEQLESKEDEEELSRTDSRCRNCPYLDTINR